MLKYLIRLKEYIAFMRPIAIDWLMRQNTSSPRLYYNPICKAWFCITNKDEFRAVSLLDEPETTRYIAAQSGDCFLDIGAYLGKYSLLASNKFRLIHAFEPNRQSYSRLRIHVVLNKRRNIKCHPVALGSQKAIATFFLKGRRSSFIYKSRRTTTVPVKPLDMYKLWLTNMAIDLVKIDVEGYEYFVLKGMRKTIKFFHPTIIVEIHAYNPYRKNTVKLLKTYGYKLERRLDQENYLFS